MRRFNVTGLCVPEKHYMVDISGKIDKIRILVDAQCYFTINRARQYGKTTTLACLERALHGDYLVVSISFEGLGSVSFESEANFCTAFLSLAHKALRYTDASDEYKKEWMDPNVVTFLDLGEHIANMCRPCPAGKQQKVVLMIDEVDATSNNRVFIRFLGMLRSKFLARQNMKDYTFHNVILAGVYDIKNIKLKIAGEGSDSNVQEEHTIYNSPWNIAAKFDIDMSFSPAEIATMLSEYESDHNTGMDMAAISEEIYSYTSGYPFLVSRICQCIDEELNKEWTLHGVQNAVSIILDEKNMLFDDLFKNLENNKALNDFMYDLLFVGNEPRFNIYDPLIELGHIYGFLKKGERNKAIAANRIFEIAMYEYFLSTKSRLMQNGWNSMG